MKSAGTGGMPSSTVNCVMFGRLVSTSSVVSSSSIIREEGVEVVWFSVAILENWTARFRRSGRIGMGFGFLKSQFWRSDLDIVLLKCMLAPRGWSTVSSRYVRNIALINSMVSKEHRIFYNMNAGFVVRM